MKRLELEGKQQSLSLPDAALTSQMLFMSFAIVLFCFICLLPDLQNPGAGSVGHGVLDVPTGWGLREELEGWGWVGEAFLSVMPHPLHGRVSVWPTALGGGAPVHRPCVVPRGIPGVPCFTCPPQGMLISSSYPGRRRQFSRSSFPGPSGRVSAFPNASELLG